MYSCPDIRPLDTLRLFTELFSFPNDCPEPVTFHVTSYSVTSSESMFGGFQKTEKEDVVLVILVMVGASLDSKNVKQNIKSLKSFFCSKN